MTMTMDEFASLLARFVDGRNATGCSVSEIETLEQTLKTTLPDDYKLFLLTCGHGVHDFARGSDFTYDQLPDLLEAANELINESKAATIPVGSVVFVMHQGYQFYFVNETGVYYYMEGETDFEWRHDSFSEFFRSVVSKVMS